MADGARVEVEAAAENLGIQLAPWQVDLGVHILNGDQLIGGRGVGRTSVMHVVNQVYRDRADSPGES